MKNINAVQIFRNMIGWLY